MKIYSHVCIFVLCVLACRSFAEEIRDKPALELKNVTLDLLQDLTATPARLVDGVFSGDHLEVTFVKGMIADLNKDGKLDGVIVVVVNEWGTGNYCQLHLLLNKNGTLIDTDYVHIGDRIGITNLEVDEDEGLIEVGVLERFSDESYATDPTVPLTYVYSIEDSELVFSFLNIHRINAE